MKRRRKRNHKRIKGNLIILVMTMILTLSIMGVGYAYWNNILKVTTNTLTGNVETAYSLREGFHDVDNADYLNVKVDENKLMIDGEVYPNFNHDLDIEILDIGSIPVVFKDIREVDNKDEVAELDKNTSYKKSKIFFNPLNQNGTRESFNLVIKPEIEELDDDSNSMISGKVSDFSSSSDDSIGRLQDEIRYLKQEIRKYNSIDRDYYFEYNIIFEQGM